MPLFKWYGLTAAGVVVQGKERAADAAEMQHLLAQRGITILSSNPCSEYISTEKIRVLRVTVFEQLGSLLGAGIHMTTALTLIGKGIYYQPVRQMISNIHDSIEDGASLSKTAAMYDLFFTPFALRMLDSGEQTGTLSAACTALSRYYSTIARFSQKMRSALLLPAIIILCFCSILTLFLYLVVPRFATLFAQFKGPLPWRTELLFSLSNWLRAQSPYTIAACIALVALGGWWLFRMYHPNTLGWYIPFLRKALVERELTVFLLTMSLLIRGNTPLSQALVIAAQSSTIPSVRRWFTAVAGEVGDGGSLSTALTQQQVPLSESCYTLIRVGEETGTLGNMLALCAQEYEARMVERYRRFGIIIQPLLLLVLGFFIALLMISLYEPIFSLGSLLR